MTPTIRCRDFILRPFRLSDAPALARNINDRTIARNTLSIPYPYRLADARSYVRKDLASRRQRPLRSVRFAVVIDGEVIGGVALKITAPHKAEVGAWLARRYWGQGMATSDLRVLLRYAFGALKLRRVYAFAFPWNKASQRVLLKCGFRREGLLRKNVAKRGRLYDHLLFAKTR